METLPAVVLAAGEGSRLRPLTEHRPKPMLPAATKPILARVFDELIAAGVTDITVVVGYGQNHVKSYFGPTYENVPLTYVSQEKQLGSGHALLTAESAVDGPCLVVNGDQVVDSRILAAVMEDHDEADATIGAIAHEGVDRYGGVLLEGDEVAEIVERPTDDRSYRLNAGVYAFSPLVFDVLRSVEHRRGEHSIIDALEALVEDGHEVRGVLSEGYWLDATYPWDLLWIAEELLDLGVVEAGVSPAATVHESAVLHEPVVVDEDAVVGPGAVVGPYVCLGSNTTIGANAVVEQSVLDADTRVGPNATLRHCVTGRGVGIGPGSTVVGGPGDVRIGEQVHTNEQLGAVLADRASDGGGVTYAAGTVVGSSARLHSGVTVRETIEAETEVID